MEFSVLTAPRYDVRSLFDVCLSARPGECERFLPPRAVAVFSWRHKKLSGKVRTQPYFTRTYNFRKNIILFNNQTPEATTCFSIISLMIIRENKIKKGTFLKDFGALRCRSRAALIDNKLVFLKQLPSVFLTET